MLITVTGNVSSALHRIIQVLKIPQLKKRKDSLEIAEATKAKCASYIQNAARETITVTGKIGST